MKRTLLIAAVVTVMAAACNGDDTADPTTPPTTPSATAAPSSTAAPATNPSITVAPSTTAPGTTAPTPTAAPTSPPSTESVVITPPAGDTDWRTVLETLGRRRQDLYRSPDVSRIGEVCSDGSPCNEQLQVQLGDMAGKGWHIEGGDAYTIIEAQLEDFIGDSLDTAEVVTVVAVVQRPADAGTIVDSSGAVVAAVETETPEGVNTRGRATLARVGPPEDPWRIVEQVRIGEAPE